MQLFDMTGFGVLIGNELDWIESDLGSITMVAVIAESLYSSLYSLLNQNYICFCVLMLANKTHNTRD